MCPSRSVITTMAGLFSTALDSFSRFASTPCPLYPHPELYADLLHQVEEGRVRPRGPAGEELDHRNNLTLHLDRQPECALQAATRGLSCARKIFIVNHI